MKCLHRNLSRIAKMTLYLVSMGGDERRGREMEESDGYCAQAAYARTSLSVALAEKPVRKWMGELLSALSVCN